MANREIMGPQEYAELKRVQDEANASVVRQRHETRVTAAVKRIMSQVQINGPDRVYLYAPYRGSDYFLDRSVIESAVTELEEAGWQVRYGRVNVWNRIYHCWFKDSDNVRYSQNWWFSLSPRPVGGLPIV